MGNLTGPEGQQAGADPRPRSNSTSAPRRPPAAVAASRTATASLGRVAATQVQSGPPPSPAPPPAEHADQQNPTSRLLQPPSPRKTVPPPSPRVEVQTTHKAPPTIEDFRAPTLAQISLHQPSAEPAPSPPPSEQPKEQAPPQPDQSVPSYPAPTPPPSVEPDTEDIWKLAASLGADDSSPSAEASGLEILDALAELRESASEADGNDEAATKRALAEIIQQASNEPPIMADFVTEEILQPSLPQEDTDSADDDSTAHAASSSPSSFTPVDSQPEIAAEATPGETKQEAHKLATALEDLTAAVGESAEATENLMAALSCIGEEGRAATDSTDNSGELMAALSELSLGEPDVEESAEDLMAALTQLGEAPRTTVEESTADLMAALAQLSEASPDSATEETENANEESTADLMAALAQLGEAPRTAVDEAEASEESTADLMAALTQLGEAPRTAVDDADTNEESTADLMAALAQLGEAPHDSSTTEETENANEESTADLMAALAGLGEPAEEPATTTDDLMKSLGELSAVGEAAEEVEAVESVEELMASLQAVEGAESAQPAIEVEDGATTEDLMATLDALSSITGSSSSEQLKKTKTMKGLTSLKQDTFLSTTWETSEGSEPAVEIPEEFAAAFAKRAESKGRKKVDVGRIGRGGRGRTKKANKPDPTQFAPMTSIEDSHWMVSPSAPPVLKKAPPAKTNNPAWMQSLFGGPDVAPPEEEELPPLDVDDTVPSASASPPGALVRDWSIKEDMNRPGLRRSKKRPIKGNKHGKKPLQMEDFNFCSYPWLGDVTQGMFCVFDGHVDKDCGQALVTAWPMTWKKITTGVDMTQATDLSDFFKKAFLTVDQELREYEYCGSTMTVVMIWEGPNKQRYLQAANVGDSLAFLCRNKTAVELSEVHCVREPSEAQRLRDAGAVVNEGATRINGLSVSRAIGDHFVKEVTEGFTAEPFVSPSFALGPEDTHLVVASDGLWDVIDGQQAVDEVQKHSSALRMSSALLQTALASKKCNDNVTVCAIVL